ncbi:hypothetical protein [Desulfovibrio inopinatus]|uniref:hypothetical protein n=1 Tax=Desulfovibrio inopinatus TaxID=102109 RepID=UPI00040AAEB5|nr:hypothetical protein [Desulfovibrio inopinatus]
MPLYDTLQKALSAISGHQEGMTRLLQDNITSQAFAHIREGQLHISQETLRRELEKIEDIQPFLKDLRCHADGIDVELEGKRFGGGVALHLRLAVETLVLTDQTQVLVLRILEETPIGQDTLGKVLCGVGSALVGSLARHSLNQTNLKQYAEFDETNQTVTIQLGELEVIQQMLKPKISNWSASAPLSIVGIRGCQHKENGVLLQIIPSAQLKKAYDKVYDFNEKSKTFFRDSGNTQHKRSEAKTFGETLQGQNPSAQEFLERGKKLVKFGKGAFDMLYDKTKSRMK